MRRGIDLEPHRITGLVDRLRRGADTQTQVRFRRPHHILPILAQIRPLGDASLDPPGTVRIGRRGAVQDDVLWPDRKADLPVQAGNLGQQVGARREAGKSDRPAVHRAVQEIGAPDEPRDEPGPRPVVQRHRIVHLLDPSVVHHHDAVRRHHRLGLVVRHIHGGDAERVVQAADLRAHLLAQVGIQIGQRLVQQQHLGLDHDRPRQRHALLLPARQFRRIAVPQMAKLHHVQDAIEPRAQFLRRQPAQLQAERHVLRHRHVRPDRIALEDHRHAAPFRRDHAVGRRQHRAVHLDRAGGRADEPRDHPQRGGLAAAGRPEQRDELTLLQGQADILHRRHGAEALAEPGQHKLAHPRSRRSMKSRPSRLDARPTITSVEASSRKPSAARFSKFPSSLMSISITDMVRVFGP